MKKGDRNAIPLRQLILDHRWDHARDRLKTKSGRKEAKHLDDIMSKRHSSDLPLHLAMWNRAPLDIVQSLVRAYPDGARRRNIFGALPLHDAAAYCTLDVVRTVAEACSPDGFSISTGEGKELPLHSACSRSPAGAVAGVDGDDNSRNDKGFDDELVRYLLSSYPDGASTPDSHGRLPLHRACIHGAPASVIAALLESYPQGLQAMDCYGLRPANYARAYSAERGVQLLLAANCGTSFVVRVEDRMADAIRGIMRDVRHFSSEERGLWSPPPPPEEKEEEKRGSTTNGNDASVISCRSLVSFSSSSSTDVPDLASSQTSSSGSEWLEEPTVQKSSNSTTTSVKSSKKSETDVLLSSLLGSCSLVDLPPVVESPPPSCHSEEGGGEAAASAAAAATRRGITRLTSRTLQEALLGGGGDDDDDSSSSYLSAARGVGGDSSSERSSDIASPSSKTNSTDAGAADDSSCVSGIDVAVLDSILGSCSLPNPASRGVGGSHKKSKRSKKMDSSTSSSNSSSETESALLNAFLGSCSVTSSDDSSTGSGKSIKSVLRRLKSSLKSSQMLSVEEKLELKNAVDHMVMFSIMGGCDGDSCDPSRAGGGNDNSINSFSAGRTDEPSTTRCVDNKGGVAHQGKTSEVKREIDDLVLASFLGSCDFCNIPSVGAATGVVNGGHQGSKKSVIKRKTKSSTRGFGDCSAEPKTTRDTRCDDAPGGDDVILEVKDKIDDLVLSSLLGSCDVRIDTTEADSVDGSQARRKKAIKAMFPKTSFVGGDNSKTARERESVNTSKTFSDSSDGTEGDAEVDTEGKSKNIDGLLLALLGGCDICDLPPGDTEDGSDAKKKMALKASLSNRLGCSNQNSLPPPDGSADVPAGKKKKTMLSKRPKFGSLPRTGSMRRLQVKGQGVEVFK